MYDSSERHIMSSEKVKKFGLDSNYTSEAVIKLCSLLGKKKSFYFILFKKFIFFLKKKKVHITI